MVADAITSHSHRLASHDICSEIHAKSSQSAKNFIHIVT